MREIRITHPFFETMIFGVLIGHEREVEDQHASKLETLTAEDGGDFGASYLLFLSSAATEEGAFGSWVAKYPALGEFSRKYSFFKPLMLSIGKSIRHTTTWHKVILSVASGLMSMSDVATDVYTVAYFNITGKTEVARLMLTFLLLSLAMQLIAVYCVHYKSKRQILIEMLGTLTFAKPAFNKFRVLTNAKVCVELF